MATTREPQSGAPPEMGRTTDVACATDAPPPAGKTPRADLLAKREQFVVVLGRAATRLARRAEAIARDLAKMDEAEAWVQRAAWLVPLAGRAARGAEELVVSDWSSGEEAQVIFPLDPARGAREQVEKVFREARRLRRGRPVAERRLEETRAAVAVLRQLADEARLVDADQDLDALAQKAMIAAPRELPRAQAAGTRGRPTRRPPHRTFVASSDLLVLVGRGAKYNDELTLHVARPHHVWLHAKGQTGAHVVALVAKGHDLTPEQLLDAAHLAAHFSNARGELVVEVSWTPRRYVRKPRKSAPGLVVLDRPHVLAVRLEPDRVARLLAGEIDELPAAAPSAKPAAAAQPKGTHCASPKNPRE